MTATLRRITHHVAHHPTTHRTVGVFVVITEGTHLLTILVMAGRTLEGGIYAAAIAAALVERELAWVEKR